MKRPLRSRALLPVALLPLPVLGIVLALLAGLVAIGVARPAGAADTTPVLVAPTSVTPAVLRDKNGPPLQIAVDVINTTGHDLDGVTLNLRIGQRLTLRDQLSNDKAPDNPVTGATTTIAKVPAGGRVSYTFSVAADKLPLSDKAGGVYAFAVQAQRGGATVGSARVLVPWVPKLQPDFPRTQIGVLWPLIDRPRRDGTTIGDNTQTPVFQDDGLTNELSGTGRLNTLVGIGKGLGNKISWVVDPDLLDAAAAMRNGYRVAPARPPETVDKPEKADKGKKGKGDDDEEEAVDVATAKAAPRTEADTTPGTGSQAAADWLNALRAAVGTGVGASDVVALPYADTDIATIAHALSGPSKTDLNRQLTEAVARGGQLTAELLGRQPTQVRSNVSWPVAGAVDDEVLATAKTAGSNLVVVSGDSMPPRKDLNYTSSTRAEIGEGTSALVTDPRVDALLNEDASVPGKQVQLQQALIAELFTIAMEEPNRTPRAVLLAPPRQMSVATAKVVESAVREATMPVGGWSELASLDTLAKSKLGEERVLRSYPQDLRRTEPSDRYLKTIPQLQQSVDTFAGILSKPERITGPYDPAVLRTLSTVWRGEGMDADVYRLGVSRGLRVLEQLVRIAPKTGVTLSGDKGTIPITVINGLQQAITVRIEVTSRQPNRLKLTEPEVTTIPAGHTSAIAVPAQSAANGKVLVDVRMLTPDGTHAFGPAQTFYVNTTSIDGITLGIIGVIAGLLALFSLRAYLRRRRAGKAGGGDASGDDGAEPGDGEGPMPDGERRADEGEVTRHTSRDRPEGHHAPA
ncbi:DUF6049 family protein [Yinghuangia seranimata]|uniref:DUF6049 family protein n=1 Tax=Yinghuangia seranimata TaxID=408067 RepID=UPI00248C4CD6|nr:DUF6049 family protein [Yinghuangia seranimata]MDI2130472.1 DUF6049 family protein [Yinghuangia seranimata]